MKKDQENHYEADSHENNSNLSASGGFAADLRTICSLFSSLFLLLKFKNFLSILIIFNCNRKFN